MSGAGTIVVSEHGATVTVCINRAFAERLIEYINAMPDHRKVEGDNQVLAGLLDTALTRATAPPPIQVGPVKMPRWRIRQQLRKRRDGIAFWRDLLESMAAEDGSAVGLINDKIARHEAAIVDLVVAFEESEKKP